MTLQRPQLWPGLQWVERGWLSANQIWAMDDVQPTVIDTGYCSHAAQTVALLEQALQGRPLVRILHTHLHSDHCGGTAALQARWPQVHTWVPAAQLHDVHIWDADALSYQPTGQDCPRFRAEHGLQSGDHFQLAGQRWEVHAAPGHDHHALLFFEPKRRILISGDALWEHGFGVVFPEIEGQQAFDAVAATLDCIAQLQPACVLPGHGPWFTQVEAALAESRQRLAYFRSHPQQHAAYAARVLLKFQLQQWQQRPLGQLLQWCANTPYWQMLHEQYFAPQSWRDWSLHILDQLIAKGAAQLSQVDGDDIIHNT